MKINNALTLSPQKTLAILLEMNGSDRTEMGQIDCAIPVEPSQGTQSPSHPINPPGGMAGEIWLAEDFDAPLDDLFTHLAG